MNMYNAEKLIKLIALNRMDNQIIFFLNQADSVPEITIDKEDGADDEYIEFKKEGFGFHFMGDILVALHFQSGRKFSDYSMYKYSLPLSIGFEQNKSEILTLLKEPLIIGGGKDGYFGPIPHWFKYKINDDLTLHIEFTKEDKVSVVTIMNYD